MAAADTRNEVWIPLQDFATFQETEHTLMHSGAVSLHEASDNFVLEGHTRIVTLSHYASNQYWIVSSTRNAEYALEQFILFRDVISDILQVIPVVSTEEVIKMTAYIRNEEGNGWNSGHLAAAMNYPHLLDSEEIRRNVIEDTGEPTFGPLVVAVVQNSKEFVIRLLELADTCTLSLDQADFLASTAGSSSCEMLSIIWEILTRKFDVIELLTHKDLNGSTLLARACDANLPEIVKFFAKRIVGISLPNDLGEFPIHIASKLDSTGVLKELLKFMPRKQLSSEDSTGNKPLHIAKNLDILYHLLDAGAEIGTHNSAGQSALHTQAADGNQDNVAHLIANGASKDEPDDDGNTPLHIACEKRHISVIEAFMAFSANLQLTNPKNGKTPRHTFCEGAPLSSDEHKCLGFFDLFGGKRCPEGFQGCNSHCARYTGTETDHPVENRSFFFDNHNSNQELDNKSAASKKNSDGILVALDGGGIKGVVLAKQMEIIGRAMGKSVISACDFAAGTSTGGILLAALATGKTPEEALCLYFRLGRKVFTKSKPYSAEKLESFLKDAVGEEIKMSSIKHPLIMIPAVKANTHPTEVVLFRNFSVNPAETLEGSDKDINLWKAVRASSAAPTYFDPAGNYIDGGLQVNNPTAIALADLVVFGILREGQRLNSSNSPSLVISLGCGQAVAQPRDIDLLKIEIVPDDWISGARAYLSESDKYARLKEVVLDCATTPNGQEE